MCPYLFGSEDAPATAKRGEEKNVLRAASISASFLWPRVVGMDDLIRSVSRERLSFLKSGVVDRARKLVLEEM